MGLPILIIGKSGSGKSSSIRNFSEDELAIIKVRNKFLPVQKKFSSVVTSDNYDEIEKLMTECGQNTILIDDAGYLIMNQFMKGHVSQGSGSAIFQFYNKIADHFFFMIDFIENRLPENKIVYLTMHEDETESGSIKPKTIGKLLNDKVCIEGMFTIVFRSIRDEFGNYVFMTQTDGYDVTKTPFGMFDELKISNDLKLVDEKIRTFYNLT